MDCHLLAALKSGLLNMGMDLLLRIDEDLLLSLNMTDVKVHAEAKRIRLYQGVWIARRGDDVN
jgi:hypothetical protein